MPAAWSCLLKSARISLMVGSPSFIVNVTSTSPTVAEIFPALILALLSWLDFFAPILGSPLTVALRFLGTCTVSPELAFV